MTTGDEDAAVGKRGGNGVGPLGRQVRTIVKVVSQRVEDEGACANAFPGAIDDGVASTASDEDATIGKRSSHSLAPPGRKVGAIVKTVGQGVVQKGGGEACTGVFNVAFALSAGDEDATVGEWGGDGVGSPGRQVRTIVELVGNRVEDEGACANTFMGAITAIDDGGASTASDEDTTIGKRGSHGVGPCARKVWTIGDAFGVGVKNEGGGERRQSA